MILNDLAEVPKISSVFNGNEGVPTLDEKPS